MRSAVPLLIILPLAALGAYLLLRKQEPQDPAPTSPEEAAMRTQVTQAVRALLAAPGVDPTVLDQTADMLTPYGFPSEVQALHARAAQLRTTR